MHVKFFMHAQLTAAGNFYKLFLCTVQNLDAADIFQLLKKYHAHFQLLRAIENLSL